MGGRAHAKRRSVPRARRRGARDSGPVVESPPATNARSNRGVSVPLASVVDTRAARRYAVPAFRNRDPSELRPKSARNVLPKSLHTNVLQY